MSIKTVAELIRALSAFPGNLPLLGDGFSYPEGLTLATRHGVEHVRIRFGAELPPGEAVRQHVEQERKGR